MKVKIPHSCSGIARFAAALDMNINLFVRRVERCFGTPACQNWTRTEMGVLENKLQLMQCDSFGNYLQSVIVKGVAKYAMKLKFQL